MPYVATSAGNQMRVFFPPPYDRLAPRPVRRRPRGVGQINPTATAGSLLTSLAPLTGPAAPFVALGGQLTALFGQIFSGCGQTCTLTSDMANKMEGFLKQNLALYQQSGHTQSEQAAALANFNAFWNQLVQFCSQPSMGNAGQRCISDRQAGACKWKDATGTCWNWWVGYHDPIANDPTVVPDPPQSQSYTTLTPSGQVVTYQTPAGGSLSNLLPAGLDWTTLALPAGLVFLGLLLFLGGSK